MPVNSQEETLEQNQKIEPQRRRGKANLLLTAPQARLTTTKCFSLRLCGNYF
jgi:hypothetical protein